VTAKRIAARWISRLLRGIPDFPLDVGVDVTNGCNYRCVYCPVSKWPQPFAVMPMDRYEKILERFREARFFGSLCLGGLYSEPLLNPNLEEYVRRAHRKLPLIWTFVNTNGELLTGDRCRALFQAGLSWITISTHGPLERKQKHLVENGVDIGHRRIRFNTIAQDTPALTNRGGLLPSLSEPTGSHCGGTSSFIVCLDGNVILCCNDYHAHAVMGNILTTSMKDIWMSPKWTRLRDELRHGIRTEPICRACNVGAPEDSIKSR
jgi:radical SAM protein with 4Fe4S-binding SPASM domain